MKNDDFMKRMASDFAPKSKKNKRDDDWNWFFKDSDKDGVPNGLDCKPYNKREQDVFVGLQNAANWAGNAFNQNVVKPVSQFVSSPPVQQTIRNATTIDPNQPLVRTANWAGNTINQNVVKPVQSFVTSSQLAYKNAPINAVPITSGKLYTIQKDYTYKEVAPITTNRIELPRYFTPISVSPSVQTQPTSFPGTELYRSGKGSSVTPNFNKVPVGDIKKAGYNKLSEMENEYKNNPEKFYAKTGYGAVDKYGNVGRTPDNYKTLTSFQTPNGSGYSQTTNLIIARTPDKTNFMARPTGWDSAMNSKEKYPGLKDTNIPETTLRSSFTLPANAIAPNMRAYMDKNNVINPYRLPAQSSPDYNIENVPRPYGWSPLSQNGPALSSGYKPDSTKPFIPASAIRDENARTYVNQDRTMVLNPYYINK